MSTRFRVQQCTYFTALRQNTAHHILNPIWRVIFWCVFQPSYLHLLNLYLSCIHTLHKDGVCKKKCIESWYSSIGWHTHVMSRVHALTHYQHQSILSPMSYFLSRRMRYENASSSKRANRVTVRDGNHCIGLVISYGSFEHTHIIDGDRRIGFNISWELIGHTHHHGDPRS